MLKILGQIFVQITLGVVPFAASCDVVTPDSRFQGVSVEIKGPLNNADGVATFLISIENASRKEVCVDLPHDGRFKLSLFNSDGTMQLFSDADHLGIADPDSGWPRQEGFAWGIISVGTSVSFPAYANEGRNAYFLQSSDNGEVIDYKVGDTLTAMVSVFLTSCVDGISPSTNLLPRDIGALDSDLSAPFEFRH
jgi:hypothetical protein